MGQVLHGSATTTHAIRAGSALTGCLVAFYGWDAAVMVLAGLAFVGTVLFLWVDAGRSLAPSAPRG